MFSIINKKHEKGQSLVIIALAFFALVAVAALVIDGGTLYVNRRNAQTAADAAAMAGAREKCVEKGGLTDIENVVNQYAITENGATAVDSVTIDANGYVVVQTRVETSSFFAGILGRESNVVRATASAGCFSPATMKDLLPIAWTCQPPPGTPDPIKYCKELDAIPLPIFKTILSVTALSGNTGMLLDAGVETDWTSYKDGYGSPLGHLVMDDDKFDPHTNCKPYLGDPTATGSINCDFDGDGILDVEAGANRGWLYLGAQQGARGLKDIVQYGYPDPIALPQWFPGENGAIAAVFKEITDYRVNQVSLVPVFNAVCSGVPDDPASGCEFQPGDLIGPSNGQPTYYRVAGFAPFVVTCVAQNSSDKCPIKKLANLNNNDKTVEGYFVSGYVAGTGVYPAPSDLGAYVISLTP